MHKITILLFSIFPIVLFASEDSALFEDLRESLFMKNDYVSEISKTGIDFNSKDKMKISEKESLSKIHINLEGPFPIPPGTTLDQAIFLILIA